MRTKAKIIIVLFIFFFIILPSNKNSRAYQYEYSGDVFKIGGFFEVNDVYEDEDTVVQDPSFKFRTDSDLDLSGNFHFKIAIDGAYDGLVRNAESNGIFIELDKVYQDKQFYLDIDEAFIDIYLDKADLRLGIQKTNWGVLDEIQPTDNLNPEDLTEFIVRQESERKIGVPQVKLDLYPISDLVVEGIFMPLFFPYRLPDTDERWFPPLLRFEEMEPVEVEVDGVIMVVPVNIEYVDVELPDSIEDSYGVGLRLSKGIGPMSLSVSYFDGVDPRPVFDISSVLNVYAPLSLSTTASDVSADVVTSVFPSLHTIQVYGMDFTTTLSSFTIRGEGAFYNGRFFNELIDIEEFMLSVGMPSEALVTDALIEGGGRGSIELDTPSIEVKKDLWEYGLGVDYIRGNTILTLQGIQDRIVDYDEDLVYLPIETFISLAIRQYFFDQRLYFDLNGLYSIEEEVVFSRLATTYNFRNNWQMSLGYILIEGDEETFFGQYEKNDELQLRLKYLF